MWPTVHLSLIFSEKFGFARMPRKVSVDVDAAPNVRREELLRVFLLVGEVEINEGLEQRQSIAQQEPCYIQSVWCPLQQVFLNDL